MTTDQLLELANELKTAHEAEREISGLEHARRYILNLEQKEMAALMGMSLANYNRLEKGRDGRSITRGQSATLKAILSLHYGRNLKDHLAVMPR